MTDLKDQLVKLGYKDPELRSHIRPVLAEISKMSRYNFKQGLQAAIDEVRYGYFDEVLDNLLRSLGATWKGSAGPTGILMHRSRHKETIRLDSKGSTAKLSWDASFGKGTASLLTHDAPNLLAQDILAEVESDSPAFRIP